MSSVPTTSVRTESQTALRADLVLFGLTAGWGLTFIFIKGALGTASPSAFLLGRFGLAVLVLAIVLRRKLFDAASWKAGSITGFFVGLGFVLQTWGLKFTTPTRSGFLTGLAVVAVPLFRTAVFRRAPHPSSFVAAALAAFGLWWMSAGSLAGAEETLLGDVLTVGCALSYAMGLVMTDRFARGVSSGPYAAAQLTIALLLSFATLAFDPFRFELSRPLIVALLYCGIFSSAISFWLQNWAIARSSAVRAALIFSLEPVFTAIFAWLFGDPPVRATLQGGAIILAGMFVAELWPRLALRRRDALVETAR